MENLNFKRFYKNLSSAFLVVGALSINVTSHAQKEYVITPKISKEIIDHYGIRDSEVYPVTYKEIEFYGLDTVQVESQRYKYVKESIEKYKPVYDKYNSELEDYEKREHVLKEIIKNLDEFLKSTEKYKLKEKYLKQAEDIAQTNQIEGILSWHKNKKKPHSDTDFALSLLSSSKLDNDEVIKYKQQIQGMGISKPKKLYGYEEYLEYLKESETVPKTEMGTIQSEKVSKRMALIMSQEAIDIQSLSGTFIGMPNYMLATRDVPNKFVKGELSDNLKGIYNSGQLGQPHVMLKNKDSNEYYYTMSNTFLDYLYQRQIKEEVIKLIHNAGYKEYKDEYGTLYIKSKLCEIGLGDRIYWELKKDPQYITKLDADQAKISSLVKQTLSHSRILDNYLSIYNIKKSNMATTDLKAWKLATANAQKLQNQIHAISQKYDGNTSFTLLDKSITKNLNIFLDNLLASKGVLRM